MKTLYLHIGTPKTGTTAIQHFLLKNRTVLEEHGYCFPELPCHYTYARNNRNGYFLTAHTGYKKGFKQLENLFGVYDNIILTEETLWRHLYVHPQIATDLMAHAKENNYQIRVIVYLRCQDEFIISLWKENVKHRKHALTLTFQERLPQVLENESFILEYASRLDELAAVFGRDQLTVRRYEKSSWKNGLIIDDFLACIGLEHTADFEELEALKNPSLSENTVEIKRIINKEPSFSQDENRYLYHFLREISADSSAAYPCSMLSKDEANELLHQFDGENARVAEEYICDGNPLFSRTPGETVKWSPDNPYLREDIIRFFALATVDLKRENTQLRSDLDDLKNELADLKQELTDTKQALSNLKKQTSEQKKTILRNHQQFLTFKAKLKHPIRTLLDRLFHNN